ncbi:unnamed protein product [Echinostoma caproni]|uniref:Secreted protein n=1 Tax=Echinostoma caproni TaxID=27848 RepID=A0A183BHB8_9TREM|nr:unnamed protein product [Echinostoma caproni]
MVTWTGFLNGSAQRMARQSDSLSRNEVTKDRNDFYGGRCFNQHPTAEIAPIFKMNKIAECGYPAEEA